MNAIAKTPFQPSFQRLSRVLKNAGLRQTCGACVSVLEDHYLRVFDRIYGVKTSGYISLSDTSIDTSKFRHANRYGPVNAWAFRKLLGKLSLPKTFHFVDLGSGLGRPCILAAQYGFIKVTGVEIAPEFCEIARRNISLHQSRTHRFSQIEIIQGDVLDYCETTTDDVFFMYRPFSCEFLMAVLSKIIARSIELKKRITIIYSERLNLPESFAKTLAQNQALESLFELSALGQQFHVFSVKNDRFADAARAN